MKHDSLFLPYWLLITACLQPIASLSAWSDTQADAIRPNIVLIVSDDQGYRDLGCFGSDEIKTPHLDRLARQGVRLTNFYVSWPACTPSRGSLLTGRYPQRHGVYDMIRNEAPDYGKKYTAAEYEVTFERLGGMDVREVLLPRMLKKAGYVSAIYGKWDLGSLQRFLPTSRGFDDFYGFVNTGIDYFTHERYGVPSMYRNDRPTSEDKGTYCTELFEREALRFLKHNHRRPFFLYVPFNAPHGASSLAPQIRGAAQAPEEFKKRYPHLKDNLVDGKIYGRPAQRPSRSKRRLEYLASVSCMDDSIGRILKQLDEYQVADRTIVIFFSDNGGGGGADNGVLRGHKGQMFEGGIRVPCLVRWPGKVKAGSVNHHFLSSMELVPTILNACGVKPPANLHLDGFDMRPVLAGQSASARRMMFWQRKDDKAVRWENWKWVESSAGNGLFDLSQDPSEQRDLSQQRPEKLAQLKQAFQHWRQEMNEVEPRPPSGIIEVERRCPASAFAETKPGQPAGSYQADEGIAASNRAGTRASLWD